MKINVSNRIGGGSDPTIIEIWSFDCNGNRIMIDQFQAIYCIEVNGITRGRFHIGHGNSDSAHDEWQMNKVLESIGAPSFRELSEQVRAEEEERHEANADRWW